MNRETKTRFAAVARHQGLSDSALLKRLIDTMLQAGSADERGARLMAGQAPGVALLDPPSSRRPDSSARAGSGARHAGGHLCLGPDARAPAVVVAAAEGGATGAEADGVRAREHRPQPQPDRTGGESG